MNAIYLQRRLTSKLIKWVGISLVALIIVSYAIWRSMNYAKGPEINIISPTDGSSISASTTLVTGQVLRAVNISINDKPINIDEQGNFKETLIIFKGINALTFKAKDQFNREVEKELIVLGM